MKVLTVSTSYCLLYIILLFLTINSIAICVDALSTEYILSVKMISSLSTLKIQQNYPTNPRPNDNLRMCLLTQDILFI